MAKFLKLFFLGIILSILSACNANSKTVSSDVVNAKGGDPIRQSGGYWNIDNAKLKELLQQGAVLVDIRRQEEWQQTGIVQGSKMITFFDQYGRVNPNFVPEFTSVAKPDQTVILICRTGNRTQAAGQAIAQQLGYKHVMNVTHGITRWIAEGRPVARYR